MYLCYRNEGYPRVAPFTSLVYLGLNRAQREGTVTIRDKSGDIVIPSEDVFLTNDAAEATQWARTGTRTLPQPLPAKKPAAQATLGV